MCNASDTTGAKEPLETDFTAEEAVYRAQHGDNIEKGIMPTFMINPNLFCQFGEEHKWNVDVALDTVKPIMQMLSLCRSMLQPVELSDGTKVPPGVGIPNMRVQAVEVKHRAAQTFAVAEILKGLIGHLASGGEEGELQRLETDATIKFSNITINLGIQRVMSPVSTHPELYALASPNEPSASLFHGMSPIRKLHEMGVVQVEMREVTKQLHGAREPGDMSEPTEDELV